MSAVSTKNFIVSPFGIILWSKTHGVSRNAFAATRSILSACRTDDGIGQALDALIGQAGDVYAAVIQHIDSVFGF